MTSKTKETMIQRLGGEEAYKQHMAAVGRRGHKGYTKKLSPDDERLIIASDKSSSTLAAEYGVSASLIRYTRNKHRDS